MSNVRKQKESQSFCTRMTSVLWMHKALDGRNLRAGKFGTRTALTAAMSNEDKWTADYLSSMIQCFSLTPQ